MYIYIYISLNRHIENTKKHKHSFVSTRCTNSEHSYRHFLRTFCGIIQWIIMNVVPRVQVPFDLAIPKGMHDITQWKSRFTAKPPLKCHGFFPLSDTPLQLPGCTFTSPLPFLRGWEYKRIASGHRGEMMGNCCQLNSKSKHEKGQPINILIVCFVFFPRATFEESTSVWKAMKNLR